MQTSFTYKRFSTYIVIEMQEEKYCYLAIVVVSEMSGGRKGKVHCNYSLRMTNL